MLKTNSNAELNLASLSMGTAAWLAPLLLAANPALGEVTRNTLSPAGSTPVYVGNNPTFIRPGQDLNGGIAGMLQTVQPGQSGLTATFKFDATVRAVPPSSTTSIIARPRDFLPGGLLSSNPLNLSIRWWDAALFNPNDPSQGLVFSESVNRIPGAPITSGFDSLGNRTFVITYNPTLPLTIDEPKTYLMGFGMTTSLNIEGMAIQIVENQSNFITEGQFDYMIANGGQGVGDIIPISDETGNGVYVSYLELPASIPEPGTAGSLLAVATGAALSRRRRE